MLHYFELMLKIGEGKTDLDRCSLLKYCDLILL